MSIDWCHLRSRWDSWRVCRFRRGAVRHRSRLDGRAVHGVGDSVNIRTLQLKVKSLEWLLGVYRDLDQSRGSVEEVGAIARDDFLERFYYRNRPAVFRGLARDWPALARWTPAYLKAACGDVDVEVMAGRSNAPVARQYAGGSLRKTIRFAAYVDMVASGGVTNDYYLVARNEFFARPGTRVLLNDIGHSIYADLKEAEETVKMWFGPAGTLTPLHHDSKNSLLVQITGTKRVRLIAPYMSPQVTQREPWYATEQNNGHVADTAREISLLPGDALFVPVGWWHAVEALTCSISVTSVCFGVPNSYSGIDWSGR